MDREQERRQQKRPQQGRASRRPAQQPKNAAQRRAVEHQEQARKAAEAQQRKAAQAKQHPAAKPAAKKPVQRPAATAPAKKRTAKPAAGFRLPKLNKAPVSAKEKRENAARAAKLKNMKQKVATAEKTERRRVNRPHSPAVPVVYTAPVPFNVRKLVLQLVSILAVVMAIVVGMSVFFKVKVIQVSGAKVYDEWVIREASGIEEGDYLMTFSRARAGGRIKANLMYVDKVRFGIKLPDTVIIDIEEFDVVYAVKSDTGLWYLMNSEGKIMEQTDGGSAGSYTKVTGVLLSNPIVGDIARAAEPAPVVQDTTPEGEEEETTPVVSITAQSKLHTAMQILLELENNGIVGEAASVNVEDLSHIELWYGQRFQVNLGDSSEMPRKIASMTSTISQLKEHDSGMLDISFKIWPDKVVYTPFE